ncbi:drug/metabolite exporter YedA [Marinithermus hydrothermalis]|uniref:EamA domain-containing protein n=1 Tax=Marinithermus hydrothermalis (strain DSM 14884 / JCM 11576 / T1) TaxID=869210 RepID=F2NLQ5_MARHT|nr:drug/metabolite exporter YedA [Marinithermus hydrothermalis]AEB10885.1 protein of unknown function DUF6 transmembrane [Marinithermus hydrothermalis DSM 14884]
MGEPRSVGSARPLGGRALPLLALAAVYVIWGSTYLGIKFAIQGFPPLMMAGLRFTLAGSLLYAFLRVRGVRPPTRREWEASAVVGGLLLVGGNGNVTVAEQWVASGLAALMVATVPLWAAVFAGLWGQWPTRLEWLGLALGFVGVALLNLEGDLRASPLGALLLLLAPALWALGSIWSRYLPLPPGGIAAAAQMLTGGGLLLLLSWGIGERWEGTPSPQALGAFVYLVVFGSLVAFSAYAYVLRTLRPALATSYAYVNPVVAVMLGVVWGGEALGGAGGVAMALILAAVALVAWGRAGGR